MLNAIKIVLIKEHVFIQQGRNVLMDFVLWDVKTIKTVVLVNNVCKLALPKGSVDGTVQKSVYLKLLVELMEFAARHALSIRIVQIIMSV